MVSAADILSNLTGISEFGQHRGTGGSNAKIQILSQTSQLLALRVLLPPPLASGSEFAVTFSFTVPPVIPQIVAISPSSATSAGGETVRLSLVGFPGVLFGGMAASSVTVTLLDEEGSQVTAVVPLRSPGIVSVSASDPSGSAVNATTPALLTAPGVRGMFTHTRSS
ncbi:hypothetical protein T484DRAFT_1775553 [Baffinella frigidus]|nr:hypothetical protein T484DRAFT_1775553 [Cryptophyta sp. CCMP2293]